MSSNPEDAFGGAKKLLGIVDMIYAAVQEPDLWGTTLQQITATMQGESIAIFAGYEDQNTPNVFSMQEMAEEAWDEFATYYAAINPIMQRSEKMFRVGETWFSQNAISAVEFEKTEFCNDFFEPHGMYHSVGIRMELGGLTSANLSIQRAKHRAPFGSHADVVLQTLKPHLQRALKLHHQMVLMETKALGLETALDAFGHAMLGLDKKGRVVLCNQAAEAMGRAGDALVVTQNELRAVYPEQDRELQTLVQGAVGFESATGVVGPHGGSMLLQRRSGKGALRVTVTPFPGSVRGIGKALAALVFLSDPETRPSSRGETLRQLYGLTPTEVRLSDLMVQGLEVKLAGERMGVTFETARFHLKKLMHKTGTKRQAELMQVMLSLPPG